MMVGFGLIVLVLAVAGIFGSVVAGIYLMVKLNGRSGRGTGTNGRMRPP